MKEMKTILAVGSIAIDTLQTPNGNRDNILGGSATYFSLAAGMFAPVKLVGVVGNDYPKAGWRLLKSPNINIDNVQVVDGKTFRWGGKYNHDYSYRETLFTELGVFESFSPVIRSEDCQSPLVFLGNIQPDLQLEVARSVTSAEYIVSDTMNLWIDLCPDKVKEVFAVSRIVLINHEEAIQFTGIKDIPDAACLLRSAGPEVVVIKMGAKGAYLSFNDRALYVPVFPVEKVVDPTGAGDSFAGGFLGCLAQVEKPDFIEAVLTGSAVASFGVENFGPESLLNVTRKSLDGRIASIRDRLFAAEDA
jgi:sugar/nucleoside kinase (ribokinase family)